MWSTISNLFVAYMGRGLLVVWFMIALIYLLVTEKKRNIRILFGYMPVIMLLLFFNPLMAELLYGFMGDEIYYRILWLIPMTMVMAYSIVRLYEKLKGRAKNIFLIVVCLIICVSGSFIYSNKVFKKAENIYHVPESVVEICDMIRVEGREVQAVFPAELLQYVRQYSAFVCMPYGREILVERWNNHSELFDEMESASVDAERLAELARKDLCAFIVLRADKEIIGAFENYDFTEYGRCGDYVVYKDSTVTLEY